MRHFIVSLFLSVPGDFFNTILLKKIKLKKCIGDRGIKLHNHLDDHFLSIHHLHTISN